MRKLFLCAAIAVLGITSVNAQEFKAGVNAGLITGDASDFYSFNLTLDAAYLWEVLDQVQVGVASGYSHSFAKEIAGFKGDDVSFLPLAAAGRLALSESFAFGADLGYAIGLNDGNDGGFYYAPRIQYGVSESIDIVAKYTGVSRDGGSFNTITLGIEFGL